tara:strand:- start:775 stop:1083 length:309 start_codon:yes stop_codon:yes gene_type:complete
MTEGLLPLLERSSAAAWKCPYYQVGFDMSWISWILTSNSLRGLSAPFLSRLEVLRLEALSKASAEAIAETLCHVDGKGELNLRHVSRLLARAEALESRMLLN